MGVYIPWTDSILKIHPEIAIALHMRTCVGCMRLKEGLAVTVIENVLNDIYCLHCKIVIWPTPKKGNGKTHGSGT